MGFDQSPIAGEPRLSTAHESNELLREVEPIAAVAHGHRVDGDAT